MNDFLSKFLVISQWQTLVAMSIIFALFFCIDMMKKKEVGFSARMLIGLVIGIICGVILQYISSSENLGGIWIGELKVWLQFFSSLFIGLIKMLVIPIISISIIKVIMDIDKDMKLSTLLTYSMFWILFSTGIAAGIGVGLGYTFDLGLNMEVVEGDITIREVQNVTQILLGLLPTNIITSMANNNIIAVVIFVFFIGFGARILGKKEGYKAQYTSFANLITALHQIIMTIADFIISLMPYAVICMMSEVLLNNGFDAIKVAMNFIILIYICMVLMLLVHLILVASMGLNPWTFLKKSFGVWLFAFSSRSSVGTLPLTLSALQNKLGVSGGVSGFVASIGTNIGLNGCSGYFPALVAVFIAHNIGVEINLSFAIMVVLVAILGSLGIAGIPGSATMAASIMLTAIGFGDYFVLLGVIIAIDPIIDMARTASNVSGAMMASVCTDKGLKTLDLKTYNA